MKKSIIALSVSLAFLSLTANAHAEANLKNAKRAMHNAPVPTTCITSQFTKTGSTYWYNIALKLTNNCNRDVDLQNVSITFLTADPINTSFWGEFNTITYPDNPLLISSQTSGASYIASMSLHIPEESWANSILHNGQFITLQWGSSTASYDVNSAKVYLSGDVPAQTGQINLSNTTAKPQNVVANFALVDLMMDTQKINTFQVPWQGQYAIPNLSPGNYTIRPQTVNDSQGGSYEGTATPSTVSVKANETVSSAISYKKITTLGSINVKVPALPSALTGYTTQPTVILTRADTGATVTKTLPWNQTSAVTNLENNITYTFSTPIITYAGNNCTGTFVPASAASKSTSPVTTELTYACSGIVQDKIGINVSGLPTSTNQINVVFQPSDGSTAVTKNVAINSGSGTDSVNLTDGVTYSVSSTNVASYSALYNPQPLTAKPNVTETITYQAQTGGRLMAYIPGWKTPPSATSVATAGYNHVLIAFGVFSTSQPGQIVPAFDTVTKAYITSLKQLGVKVLLSLGGASTSLPNTTVDFHQALTLAGSSTQFQQTFIQSIQSLVTQYGFDGIDIDIEHGLNGGGTFTAPTGDIAVMANILNTLHQNNPNLLISLTPQTANVSPTSGYDGTWGNYAALIMQTYKSLSWVGVQIYNTGCVYGLDLVCYADDANSPNLSVAMAAGLLENWPSKTASGQSTGFKPYISYLTPSQVVVGYPAPNRTGASDGAPVKSTAVIKRVIQCLRNGTVGSTGCGSYVPPRTYPGIGGVFEWEITYDQDNNFKFATDLKACVVNGSC